MTPDVVLSYEDKFPPEMFADFASDIDAANLSFASEARPSGALYASFEWLAPTAIVAYLAKPYFDGFLSEAGKEHYHQFKMACAAFAAKLARVKATVVGTPGKVRTDRPYSLIFSFETRADGIRIKAMIPENLSSDDAAEVVGALLDFMRDYQGDSLSDETRSALAKARVIGRMILVSYDITTKKIVFPDALSTEDDGL